MDESSIDSPECVVTCGTPNSCKSSSLSTRPSTPKKRRASEMEVERALLVKEGDTDASQTSMLVKDPFSSLASQVVSVKLQGVELTVARLFSRLTSSHDSSGLPMLSIDDLVQLAPPASCCIPFRPGRSVDGEAFYTQRIPMPFGILKK